MCHWSKFKWVGTWASDLSWDLGLVEVGRLVLKWDSGLICFDYIPIGSIYAIYIYMIIYHQYTVPQMFAYIPYMDPKGIWSQSQKLTMFIQSKMSIAPGLVYMLSYIYPQIGRDRPIDVAKDSSRMVYMFHKPWKKWQMDWCRRKSTMFVSMKHMVFR